MQAHEERKNFAEKYYPQVWRFLSKTRRACPCAVGDVLTLQSKNMFQKFHKSGCTEEMLKRDWRFLGLH